MRIDRIGAPMREQAVRNLRSAIVTGQFQPGQRLPEREICELLGASRTVVREALRHLESEGLVETIPGHGPAVSIVTEKTIRDVFEARSAIEGMAAELCAARAGEDAMARLRQAYEQLMEAYRREDVDAVLLAKEGFYDALYRGAGNEVVHTFIRRLHARVTQLRNASLSRPGRLVRSREELRQLMEAIQRRDGKQARALAERHVKRAETAALAVLMEHATTEVEDAHR